MEPKKTQNPGIGEAKDDTVDKDVLKKTEEKKTEGNSENSNEMRKEVKDELAIPNEQDKTKEEKSVQNDVKDARSIVDKV